MVDGFGWRGMDGLADPAVLEARRLRLLQLLHNQNVIVAVFPRFLALSLAFRAKAEPPLRRLRFCTSGAEALAALEPVAEPFWLLVSEHLSDGPGLELVRAVKARDPGHRCLLVLTHNHRLLADAALAAGADALVLEESLGRSGALVVAVERLRAGDTFVDPAMATTPPAVATASVLSPREVEVLQLVAHGLSNREIGERLHIAPTTARDHVQEILRRLGVRSRAAAAVEGVRKGYC
ncbi:MAG: LuxR C-terminal-related transcriptional regulator [Synechococcaceae cyanobacterium]|jgi:DNA-binding NarL/FixJ family response regulator